MVSRPIGGKIRICFDHMLEKRHGIANGEDFGVGLEQSIVESEIGRRPCDGNYGIEDFLCGGEVRRIEELLDCWVRFGFLRLWGCFVVSFLGRFFGEVARLC